MTDSNVSPNKEKTMNKKSSTGAGDLTAQMAQSAILGAIFQIVFGLFSSIGGFLTGGIVSWQNYVLLVTPIVVFILGLTGLVLLRRGKSLQGSSLVFITNLILPIVAVLLQTGLGWAVFIYALTSSIILIWQVVPKVTRSWTVILTTLSLALIAAMEWFNPSTRVAAGEELSTFFYGAGAILVAIFLVQAVRQSWGLVSGRLQLKIVIWAGSILSVISIILSAYSALTSRQTAIETAKQEALAFAGEQANLIRADSEVPLNTARALAQALTAAKDPDNTYRNLSRSQVNAMLRQVLIENPTFLGVDTLWEPDAFDGQDSFYRGKEGHDLTGRFIPYWVRGDEGSISLVPLVDYETPGLGDWYILPRLTKQEVILAPLIYPINGVDTVMASFVTPIVYDNEFYGIIGIDAPISYVQNIVDSTTLYGENTQAFLITSSGNIIGFQNKPELVNQPISTVIPDFFAGTQTRVAAGEVFTETSPDGEYLRVFHPLKLGKTNIVWSFGLIIPLSSITAEATTLAIREAMIGILLMLVGLVMLWFLIGRVVLPIRTLTTAATAISQGNLNTIAEVQTTDETGVLANAFNLMITQLGETLATLEQRVAERTRNLELAAEVGRTVSQVRALDVMLTEAAELIRKQFNLYYVQVYLTDPSQTYLNLQAGTGQVGEQLLARSHRLPLDTGSINGRAAIEKQSVVISDTAKSPTFKPNPLLPHTRSEMAVPLVIGEKVVGVLDMQSEHAGSLSTDILAAFEALAGQLAIAIQNATFLAEAQQARAEVESQARRLTRSNWAEYLDAVHKPEEMGFVFEHNQVAPLTQEQATGENATAAPIAITGETLGNLVVEMEGGSPIARTEELVNTVARQVAQHIENLRLLDSAERFRFEAEQAARRLTHEGWQEYTDTAKGGYIYDLNQVRPYERNEMEQAEETGVNLPLKVGDETIGKLVLKGVDAKDTESVEMASAVAERLSAHIEGLRLTMQTEQALTATKKQAQREQALRQITSAVRSSTDPAVIMRSAARELGTLLGRKTIVRLATARETQPNQQHPPADIAESPNVDGGDK